MHSYVCNPQYSPPIIFGDFSRQARATSKPQIPMLWKLAKEDKKSWRRFEASSIIPPIGIQEPYCIFTQIHIPNHRVMCTIGLEGEKLSHCFPMWITNWCMYIFIKDNQPWRKQGISWYQIANPYLPHSCSTSMEISTHCRDRQQNWKSNPLKLDAWKNGRSHSCNIFQNQRK